MQEDQSEGYYKESDAGQPDIGIPVNAESTELGSVSPGEVLVSWTASEYINRHKPPAWYAAVLASSTIIAGTVFLLTGDLVSTVVVMVVGILFAVFAGRKPEVRAYELTTSGLIISGKLYPYGLFKSYAVHEQDAIRSLYLLPIKRFMPGINLYYPPENEEQIIDVVSSRLPLEDRDPDAIDKFMNKIGF